MTQASPDSTLSHSRVSSAAPRAAVADDAPPHSGAQSSSSVGNTKGLLVVGLLLLGILAVYLPPLFGVGSSVASAERVYVTDWDFWRRTAQEQTVSSSVFFDLEHSLDDVPLTVGDWEGQEMPETNREVEILLEPEQYVRRLYQNSDGYYVWMSLIGGRSSQPFHAPDICYDADGWTFNMNSHAFQLEGGGQISGLWLTADKPSLTEGGKPLRHVVSYFYIFPNAERTLSDGIVLFKLTSDLHGSAEETLARQEDFVRSLFAGVGEG